VVDENETLNVKSHIIKIGFELVQHLKLLHHVDHGTQEKIHNREEKIHSSSATV